MAIANFQKQVAARPCKGVAGDKATLNPFVYTDRNYIAETAADTPVVVGNFVYSSVKNDTNTSEPSIWSAVAVQANASALNNSPLGIVQRNLSYRNPDIYDGGTLNVPDNAPLNVVVKGDMYVVSATAATVGQAVFASTTTGAISTAAVGGTVAGSVETPWKVVEGGAAGDIITISNWGA